MDGRERTGNAENTEGEKFVKDVDLQCACLIGRDWLDGACDDRVGGVQCGAV